MSEISSSVILHDDYDARAYSETLDMYPRLRSTVESTSARLPTAPALIEDMFYSLYRPVPTLRSPEELAPSATINRSIIEEMMNTTQWESVRRAGTVGDQFYAALATATVAGSVLTALDQKILKRLRELSEAEAEAERLFERAETLEDLARDAEGDRAQTLYDQAKAARAEAEHYQQEAETVAQNLEEDAEKIEDATRIAARDALERAEGDIEATDTAVKTFTGGYGTGASDGAATMTLKEKMALAGKIGKSERLKQIAELCGRMTRIALQVQRSKIKHPPDEIIGISIGDDIAKMLPAELAQLADPVLEDFFFKKYAEKRLMQLDMIGSEKQGRGPVIAALDSSGSMTGTLGSQFTKEAWSKAVMLALLAIARKQKRDFAVLHFSHAGQMKAYQFARGEAKPNELLATTEWFYNGGTEYGTWMAAALKLVETSKFDRADVICISDGEVYIDQQLESDWNRRRKARGMRCYSVLIGDQSGASTLARISDAIATIDNLTQDNQALEMMFAI